MSRIPENNYYANNYNGPVTGTEKVTIKSTPDGIVTKEKSSYHNPNTGISKTSRPKPKLREAEAEATAAKEEEDKWDTKMVTSKCQSMLQLQ